jgi:hypothetical protein
MLAEIINDHDVRVAQLAGGGRLVAKPHQYFRFRSGHENYGDEPSDGRIKSAEHLALAIVAKFALDLVSRTFLYAGSFHR